MPDSAAIEERVIAIVGYQVKLAVDRIPFPRSKSKAFAHLGEYLPRKEDDFRGLGLDDIDVYEVLLGLEAEFEADLIRADMEEVTRLADVIALVERAIP